MRHLHLTVALLACIIDVTSGSTVHAQSKTAPSSTAQVRSDSARIGTYDLEITTDNGTMTGSMMVKQVERELMAALTVGGHSPDVKSFKRSATGYVIEAGTPSFTVSYKLRFAGDSVTGNFTMSTGLAGTVSGVRKP